MCHFLQMASRKQLLARKMRLLDKIGDSHLSRSEFNLVCFTLFKEKQLGAALEKVHLLGVLVVLDRESLAAHISGGPNPSGAALATPGP